MKSNNKKQEPLDFQKVWLMFKETDRKFKETDLKFKETDRKFKETDLKFQESEQRLKETERIIKESSMETDKQMKELQKTYGGVSKNMGDAAEDFFYNGLSSTMLLGSIKYDIIQRNIRRKIGEKEGEFDTLLINSKTVVVVEVKYKLHPEQVKNMIEKKIPDFKELYPEYKRYKIYGAFAGFAIPVETKRLAQQNGLYILTQKGDNITLINDKGFNPVSF